MLDNEELHNFRPPASIARVTKPGRMVWAEACLRDHRKAYKVLVGATKGERPLAGGEMTVLTFLWLT